MPTTDDTHYYFRGRVRDSDAIVVVPSELTEADITEIEAYFASVIVALKDKQE